MCVFVLWPRRPLLVLFFFFNDTATTEIYTLSLHDALPISSWADLVRPEFKGTITMPHPASSGTGYLMVAAWLQRSEEHTSELQSHLNLVCRLLLEKKKTALQAAEYRLPLPISSPRAHPPPP